jgi:hypothetical protein
LCGRTAATSSTERPQNAAPGKVNISSAENELSAGDKEKGNVVAAS